MSGGGTSNLQGGAISARVGASLLNAIGLPELITNNIDDYEKTILHYSLNPKKLIELKKKLDKKIFKTNLFNSENYTKDLETLLKKTYESNISNKNQSI